MRAIVQERYGAPEEVLRLVELDTPAVADDQALVRVRASTVAGDDWHLVRGLPYMARLDTGLRRPKRRIPGQDVAGHVVAVGPGVTELRPGDEVFGWSDSGAFAEYAAIPEGALAPKPETLTFQQAAAVPISAFTALQGLRDGGEIRAGQRVLVNGAAGGVGTFAVQIARALGGRVTGVCSARNEELVRSLGAEGVVDYTREDFTDTGPYDLILDMVGNRPIRECRRALAPDGTLVMVGGRGGRWFMGTDRWLRGLALSPFIGQRLRPLIHSNRREDLLALTELIDAGKVSPVVDRHVPLDAVPEAIRGFEAWHASGKVVVTM